jgi:hypothetical protein
MRASTKICKEYGQPEISVECDDKAFLVPGLQWLLKWLETEVTKGRRFLPGETVQVGWSILEIRQHGNDALTLFEPDFKSMPIKFVDSVSNTLFHLLLQKSVVESLGLMDEILPPRLQDSAIICTEFGKSESFMMSRLSPTDADSGWFFGCSSSVHDHQRNESLRRISLYEAAIRLEVRVIPFLALPADIYVEFCEETPYFMRGDRELVIHSGSYLHLKYIEKTSSGDFLV